MQYGLKYDIMRVAIIGTQGVPANYGGFESLVENLLGDNCPGDIEYTVFCSSRDISERRSSYKGATLKYVGLHANGAQSILYDIVSMCKACRGYDVILVLGVSGCMFLPVMRLICGSKIIVNIDGLEHRRAKWGKLARWVLRNSEALAVKHAHAVIADNKGIQDYVAGTYGKPSVLIEYGGDHVRRQLSDDFVEATLCEYGLEKGNYAITVCRIEPENNSHIILEAFANTDKKLVFVGNWGHSAYSEELYAKYKSCENIRLLNAIYDLDTLYALRSNAGIYVHGHSAGGTNPSLVEAMFFGIPIIAYDVVYNKETTENKACYFSSVEELIKHIRNANLAGESLKEVAERRYTWNHISQKYCQLFR